jgi:carbonic anhydrase/acetyltransferase-like protein (isoleucine patch superfamily)
VGLKATVMNGCRVGSDAMLAAGALLTEHKEIPPRELWAGAPARRVREIDDAQAAGMQAGVAHYVLNGRMHKAAVEG